MQRVRAVIDKSAPRADKRTSRLRVRVARPVARFNLSENFLRSDGDERNARKMTAIHQRRGNGRSNHPRNPWTRPCFHERSPLGRKLRNVPDCVAWFSYCDATRGKCMLSRAEASSSFVPSSSFLSLSLFLSLLNLLSHRSSQSLRLRCKDHCRLRANERRSNPV